MRSSRSPSELTGCGTKQPRLTHARYLVEEITTPTLIIHARDDHLNPFSFGEYTAQHICGAQFLPLATGGHLLLGHHAEIRARANAFLRQYAAGAKQ